MSFDPRAASCLMGTKAGDEMASACQVSFFILASIVGDPEKLKDVPAARSLAGIFKWKQHGLMLLHVSVRQSHKSGLGFPDVLKQGVTLPMLAAAMASKDVRIKVATAKMRKEAQSSASTVTANKRKAPGFCPNCSCETCQQQAQKQKKKTRRT